MPGVASAATSIVIAHVAAGTSKIRVGAGGIMLPNHAPLVIAEQFGTLASLHPGRIDLGLGRAPGTDQRTARALRRNPRPHADGFPADVVELMSYLATHEHEPPVRAIPGTGTNVPIWILGSSLYGAQLAAATGFAVCLRLPLRPRRADARDRRLPRAVPAVAAAGAAVRDARSQRHRRRHRRRSAAAADLPAAGLRATPPRPPRTAAAARSSASSPGCYPTRAPPSSRPSPAPSSARPTPYARDWRRSSPAPAPTS